MLTDSDNHFAYLYTLLFFTDYDNEPNFTVVLLQSTLYTHLYRNSAQAWGNYTDFISSSSGNTTILYSETWLKLNKYYREV